MIPDKLRNIDPRDVPRDFSCDFFVERGAPSRFLVNGEIGFGFPGIEKGRVSAAIICDRSVSIIKGRRIDQQNDKDYSQKEGIGIFLLYLSPTAEQCVFVGNLKLSVDSINSKGAYMTVSSPKILLVQRLAPDVEIRQMLEEKALKG